MCTLTCITSPTTGAAGTRGPWLRVVFSRDELRTRLPAQPPAWFAVRGRRVVMPRDADAGGTWIAATDAGLVLALLNVNRRPPGPGLAPGGPSRGDVIPQLLDSASALDALERMRALSVSSFLPFRVLAFDRGGTWTETLWSGTRATRRAGRVSGALLRTSSSLGDSQVRGPRRRLFDVMLRATPVAAQQDAFHRHQLPGRESTSVRMARPDARTVSVTTVELDEAGIRMAYEAL